MKNTLFSLLCFIMFSLCAHEPSFKFVGKEELSGYDIYDITQNHDGIIYLGTNNGVYKYDGLIFVKLKSPKLKDKSFVGFKMDDSNNIYCYNLIGEIYKVSNDSISHQITIPEDYLTDYFSFEFTEKNEIIFSFSKPIIRNQNGLYNILFEDKSLEYFENDIHKMEDGRIVLFNSTTSTVYIYHQDGDWQQIDFAEHIAFNHKISIDSEGESIYLLDHQSYRIYKILGQSYSSIELDKPKDDLHIQSFSVYSGGGFSLSIRGGGVLLYNNNGEQRYQGQVLFDKYVFSGFLNDREGNFWMTTLENAILLFNNAPIESYVNHSKLDGEFVNRVSFCSSGRLFLGTMSGKILYEKDGTFQLFYNNKPHVINYLEHKSNRLYASKGSFDTQNSINRNITKPNSWFINNDFEQIGDFFFYATAQGLILQNEIQNIDTVLLKARINTLEYIESTKTLWVATNKGLYSYYNNVLTKSSSLNTLSIPIDLQSINDKLWVATESDGLFLYDDGKVIRHLTLNNGLLSLEIRKILCVDNRLFISHSKGLQIYNMNTGLFRIINTSDGLLANNIRDFDVYKNYIALVTHEGLQKLDYTKLEKEAFKPEVLFTHIASKEGILYEEYPELNYSNNSIIFQFSSYVYRYDISYKYRLIKDGNESVGWNKQLFSSNIMHYPSLSPGDYIFQIKSVTDHLQESEIKSYAFRIKHPFWETIPFWIIVFIVVAKVIYVFYKYTVKKIKKENQIKTELYTSKLTALKSQMNPHFIFNSLNSIQALILKEDVTNSYNYIVKFSSLVRNTLTYSDKSFIDFNDEINLLKMYLDLEKLRFKEDFNYSIEIEQDLTGFIPPMLIQPFVENAIKHGLLHLHTEKEVRITFKLGDVLLCSVEDNGIGREKSLEIKKRQGRKHEAFSLQALEKRFKILNEIYGSEIGFKIIDLKLKHKAVGTRVEIRIPVKKTL